MGGFGGLNVGNGVRWNGVVGALGYTDISRGVCELHYVFWGSVQRNPFIFMGLHRCTNFTTDLANWCI